MCFFFLVIFSYKNPLTSLKTHVFCGWKVRTRRRRSKTNIYLLLFLTQPPTRRQLNGKMQEKESIFSFSGRVAGPWRPGATLVVADRWLFLRNSALEGQRSHSFPAFGWLSFLCLSYRPQAFAKQGKKDETRERMAAHRGGAWRPRAVFDFRALDGLQADLPAIPPLADKRFLPLPSCFPFARREDGRGNRL